MNTDVAVTGPELRWLSKLTSVREADRRRFLSSLSSPSLPPWAVKPLISDQSKRVIELATRRERNELDGQDWTEEVLHRLGLMRFGLSFKVEGDELVTAFGYHYVTDEERAEEAFYDSEEPYPTDAFDE